MRKIAFSLLLILTIKSSFAQNDSLTSKRKHTNSFNLGYKQIKEEANFGLVFSGPIIKYGHNFHCENIKRRIEVDNELGLGTLFSREIPGIDFYLKLLETSYLFKKTWSNSELLIGPVIKMEYNYNLYPDLQSGFDYWVSNYSVGINSAYFFKLFSMPAKIKFKTSLFGFVSRQAEYRNPYFYDLGFSHAIKHLNSDLNFKFINQFNSASVEIQLRLKEQSRYNWSYRFDYYGYNVHPKVFIMVHSIRLEINKK